VRRIYACRLELDDGDERGHLVARALTKRWVGAHHGGWPEDAPTDWSPDTDARVRWRASEHEGATAFELTWTRPHRADASLWRSTLVQIITTVDAGARVVVSERLESHDAKVRGGPPDEAEAPELVREIVANVRCFDGGWDVHVAPVPIAADRALELDAFVRAGRRLPVVLIAADRAGRIAADAPGLAAALAGLAHVVTLVDAAAVAAVGRELGPGRAVETGGVRVLWPEWRSTDPPGRHPQWRAEEVAGPDGPRPRLVAAVRELVTDAATLRVDDDPFAAELARAESVADLAHRRAELARRQRAAQADQAAAHDLVDEYQRELTHADEEAFRLEAALERERELRLRAEHAYLRLATRAEDEVGEPEVHSLLDAVLLAKRRLEHLVILPEAERSARTWQYDRGDLVWGDLVRLDSVAADWAAGRLGEDLTVAMRARGLDWARDISENARQKFAADYQRRYDGAPVMLGPHLRRSGRQILRIYCYLDRDRRRIVIGHVGGHLGDGTA
jgi:hypothetical protein